MPMIAFTQYLKPDGRRREIYIERPEEISRLATEFTNAGGRLEIELLSTNEVSITAELTPLEPEPEAPLEDVDVDEDPLIAIEIVPNGPGVKEAVDCLITRAHAKLLSKQKST